MVSNTLLVSRDDTLLVAFLAPVSTAVVLNGHLVSVHVDTVYPFGDNATITVSNASGINIGIRIPSWATSAELSSNSKPYPARNGTISNVPCTGTCTIVLDLHPNIRVETGWGVIPGPVHTIKRNPNGATLPTNASSWKFSGGAGVSGSKLPGAQDIRSGNPGESSMAVITSPLDGEGYPIEDIYLEFV